MTELLRVESLCKDFTYRRSGLLGRVETRSAVCDVSLVIKRGEAVGLVGESGSGKSTLAALILRLLDPTSGTITFDGFDVTLARGADMRRLRREVQMVFQDPSSSLDPRMTVEQIVAEGLPRNIRHDRSGRRARVSALLDMVGMSAASLRRYPHEFSGGQRQRIGIARALAVEPRLLVLDEPVSALDVSVQAQVLNLLTALRRHLGLTYLFISHDLNVVDHLCEQVLVMYEGRIVEQGLTEQIFTAAEHPYTRRLLAAASSTDFSRTSANSSSRPYS